MVQLADAIHEQDCVGTKEEFPMQSLAEPEYCTMHLDGTVKVSVPQNGTSMGTPLTPREPTICSELIVESRYVCGKVRSLWGQSHQHFTREPLADGLSCACVWHGLRDTVLIYLNSTRTSRIWRWTIITCTW